MDGVNIDSVYGETGQGGVLFERPLPAYRLVRKNGTLGLQRAVEWHNGNSGGVDWRDEPTIDLDEPKTEL